MALAVNDPISEYGFVLCCMLLCKSLLLDPGMMMGRASGDSKFSDSSHCHSDLSLSRALFGNRVLFSNCALLRVARESPPSPSHL